jgi:hypothetical protein
MAIDDFTTAMKELGKSGPADVKLSTETRDAYLKIIKAFRDSLQTERDKMPALEALGNPGTLGSAGTTKNNLQRDVTGSAGIERTLDKYLHYLDEFEKTVKEACKRLIESG